MIVPQDANPNACNSAQADKDDARHGFADVPRLLATTLAPRMTRKSDACQDNGRPQGCRAMSV